MFFNPILATDSYKTTHYKQYPYGTEQIYSYYESRGGLYKETVFFGLQSILKSLAHYTSVEDIDYARRVLSVHFGADHLNVTGWAYLAANYPDFLPLRIKAVPEGTVVPTHNVLMTVENTDPRCYWLTNFMETVLCHVWYPMTVATLSREIKKSILKGLKETGTPELIQYMLHDFGMRGATNIEAAALGGAAHLVNFSGTDTLPALELILDRYTIDKEKGRIYGASVPASEHSTMTSWGREHEKDAYANMLNSYPDSTVSVVSDSYDVFNACKNIWGGDLKAQVLNHKGKVVVRPDSGEPVETIVKVLMELGQAFGWHTNDKGYAVLPENVRVLWGDGIDHKAVKRIIKALKKEEISLDNVSFGMGGGLLQKIDRDTQKLAFKCSWAQVQGEGRDVWKDPITSPGKQSKRGRLKLVLDAKGKYATVPESDPRPDQLVTVYDNAPTKLWDFEEIRERASL